MRAGQAYAAAERSVHGGRGGEGSRHGADRSFRGMAAAALAAVRLERSVHGGRGASQAASRAASQAASREGTQHGGVASPFAQSAAAASWLDPGASSMRRTGSAKQLAGGERSARGGSARGGADRSARGGEGSRHGGSAGMRRVGSAMLLERAGSAKPGPGRSATMFLPVATPYSHRLAELLDSLQLAPGAAGWTRGLVAGRPSMDTRGAVGCSGVQAGAAIGRVSPAHTLPPGPPAPTGHKIDRAQLQRGLRQIGYHLQEVRGGQGIPAARVVPTAARGPRRRRSPSPCSPPAWTDPLRQPVPARP